MPPGATRGRRHRCPSEAQLAARTLILLRRRGGMRRRRELASSCCESATPAIGRRTSSTPHGCRPRSSHMSASGSSRRPPRQLGRRARCRPDSPASQRSCRAYTARAHASDGATSHAACSTQAVRLWLGRPSTPTHPPTSITEHLHASSSSASPRLDQATRTPRAPPGRRCRTSRHIPSRPPFRSQLSQSSRRFPAHRRPWTRAARRRTARPLPIADYTQISDHGQGENR